MDVYMILDKRRAKGGERYELNSCFYFDNLEEAELGLAHTCKIVGVPNDDMSFFLSLLRLNRIFKDGPLP